jgi:Protein of unknown function (DUF1236)
MSRFVSWRKHRATRERASSGATSRATRVSVAKCKAATLSQSPPRARPRAAARGRPAPAARLNTGTTSAACRYVIVVARQEATMKTLFGCAAAILVATTAVNAQTTIIERDSPSIITRERVELTPAQRTTIYRTITRERVRAAAPGVDVRLGARVPQAVELSELPTAVIEDVPSVRRYRYMVVDNEVVLVDPATSEVVEIIRQ